MSVSCEPYSVLVVDDDAADRKQISRILRKSAYPFRVNECDSADRAVHQMRSKKYECILMDHHLGGVDSFEVLGRVGSNAVELSSIILITGQGNEEVAATAFRKGMGDYLSKSSLDPHQLVRSILGVRRKHKLKVLSRQSAQQNDFTGLTPLSQFTQRLQECIADAGHSGRISCLAYIDLDSFKPVNDTHGHNAGDAVLSEVASRLQYSIRAADVAARIGGDEFVILHNKLHTASDCEQLARRLQKILANPFYLSDGIEVRLTASIGVTLIRDSSLDADTILRHAGHSMYQAKSSGRNRVCFFDPDAEERIAEEFKLRNEVLQGLSEDQFQLYFQPKIRLDDCSLVGFESLIRWQHPVRGFLNPADFQYALESDDLSSAIGEWVLRKALLQLDEWRRQDLRTSLSVNISPAMFQCRDFVNDLKAILKTTPAVSPEQLELEILESSAISEITAVQTTIKKCHSLGVGVALDDFGTGYSSLACLRQLSIDTLKIDRSFVMNMLSSSNDRAIVSSIISLCGVFGREALAEGIESDSHIEMLVRMGCNFGQGYGISRPMPSQDVLPWVRDRLPLIGHRAAPRAVPAERRLIAS